MIAWIPRKYLTSLRGRSTRRALNADTLTPLILATSIHPVTTTRKSRFRYALSKNDLNPSTIVAMHCHHKQQTQWVSLDSIARKGICRKHCRHQHQPVNFWRDSTSAVTVQAVQDKRSVRTKVSRRTQTLIWYLVMLKLPYHICCEQELGRHIQNWQNRVLIRIVTIRRFTWSVIRHQTEHID